MSSAVVTIAVLVLRNATSHAPVQKGTAPEFWMVACDIDVDGSMEEFNYIGGTHPPQGEWAIYYITGYHNQFLHRVRLSELAPHLPKIENELKDRAKDSEIRSWLSTASNEWTREGSDEQEVRRLLALMRESYLAAAKEDDEELHEYILDNEQVFHERWKRADRYWQLFFSRSCG